MCLAGAELEERGEGGRDHMLAQVGGRARGPWLGLGLGLGLGVRIRVRVRVRVGVGVGVGVGVRVRSDGAPVALSRYMPPSWNSVVTPWSTESPRSMTYEKCTSCSRIRLRSPTGPALGAIAATASAPWPSSPTDLGATLAGETLPSVAMRREVCRSGDWGLSVGLPLRGAPLASIEDMMRTAFFFGEPCCRCGSTEARSSASGHGSM